MEEAAIYRGLQDIFADVFLRDDIKLTAATTARDVEGWDSMKQVEIIIAAEEQFNVKASSKELDGLKSVGDLVELISRKAA